jgi:hypothetical protein
LAGNRLGFGATGVERFLAGEVVPDGLADHDIAAATINCISWRNDSTRTLLELVATLYFQAAGDAPPVTETLESALAFYPIDQCFKVLVCEYLAAEEVRPIETFQAAAISLAIRTSTAAR